jgi:hypothetical protein
MILITEKLKYLIVTLHDNLEENYLVAFVIKKNKIPIIVRSNDYKLKEGYY